MKKLFSVVLVISLVLAMTGPAMAQEKAKITGPFTKLGRGGMNLLDAVCEVPGTMMRESKANGIATGLTKGLAVGALNMVTRTFVGVYEIVFFYLPDPEGYGPIMDPPKFLSTK